MRILLKRPLLANLVCCALMAAGASLLLPAGVMAADAAHDAKQIFDRQLSNTEAEVVRLANAMPEAKFDFAPRDGKDGKDGSFQGVRTFAQQARHIAYEINIVSSALLGEPAPPETKNDNGPDNLTTKDAVMKYVRDSFAHAHKAVATLTNANLMEQIGDPFNPKGKRTRVDTANILFWHTYDHYGQMVVYLRMNNLTPPTGR